MSSSSTKEDQKSTRSVAIVGGGVSGLAAAYKLKSHGLNVTLFEAEERAGGKLRSVSQDGLVWDEGANTMTETEAEVGNLINNLGLQEKQQFPISQNKRYIVRNGKPELLPSDPIALIRSNFLCAQTKLRIFLEPLLWRRSEAEQNASKVSNECVQESVGNFFQRHFGKEVVDYLVDPFIAGTSGGDPESLSMRHAFPEMWHLEKKFGSIVVGAICSKFSGKREQNGKKKTSVLKRKHQRGSFSFHGGMQTLTDMICKELGNSLKLKSKVLSLSYDPDKVPLFNNWLVSYSTNSTKRKELSQNQSFDAVIVTAPLCNVKEMKIAKRGKPFPLNFLPQVNYLPISVIITSFRKENVKRPLEGFGVLIPSKEQDNGLKTLGTLFSSIMFPDRAPSDQFLYTTFVGGSRNRDLARASLCGKLHLVFFGISIYETSQDELLPIVTSDLRKLLGVEGQPTFVKHVYWSNAFPLYGHDYDSVLEAIAKMEGNLPGFFYAGNHRDGLSVGKAIASGFKAADLAVSYLNATDKEMLIGSSLS